MERWNRSRISRSVPCAWARARSSPSTIRTKSQRSSESGMKSVTRTVPWWRAKFSCSAPVNRRHIGAARFSAWLPERAASVPARDLPATRRSTRLNRTGGNTANRWNRCARPRPPCGSRRSVHSPRSTGFSRKRAYGVCSPLDFFQVPLALFVRIAGIGWVVVEAAGCGCGVSVAFLLGLPARPAASCHRRRGAAARRSRWTTVC